MMFLRRAVVLLAFLALSVTAHAQGACGTDEYGSLGIVTRRTEPHASNNTQAVLPVRIVRLAVETDTKFYEENGANIPQAESYARSLVSEASRIFERELGVGLEIVYLKMYTSDGVDPYQCNGNGVVLGQKALDVWKDNTTVDRDAVLCLTSGGGGGIGYMFTAQDGGGVTSVCTPSALAAASPFAGEKLPSTGYTYSVYIVAHELGHVLGSVHSHNCYWAPALDSCTTKDDPAYASGDACTSLPNKPRPNPGSIMSYCSGINYDSGFAWGVRMTLLEQIQDYIASQLAAASCQLTPNHPVVMLLSPHGTTVESSSSVSITWRSYGVNDLVVEWLDESSGSWTEIARKPGASHDSLSWQTPSRNCAYDALIRVRSLADSVVADTSVIPVHVTTSASQCLQVNLPLDEGTTSTSCIDPIPGFGGDFGNDRHMSPRHAWIAGSTPIQLPNALGPKTEGTLLLWFNTVQTDGVQHLVGTDWQEAATAALIIWQGTIGGAVWSTAASAPIQTWGIPAVADQWYQVALTFDDGQTTLYVNGSPVHQLPLPAPVTGHIATVYVGKRGNNAELFRGSLDDVRIYSCALGADSINALYEQEKPTPSHVNADNSELQVQVRVVGESLVIDGIDAPTVTVHDVLGRRLEVSNEYVLSMSPYPRGVLLVYITSSSGGGTYCTTVYH